MSMVLELLAEYCALVDHDYIDYRNYFLLDVNEMTVLQPFCYHSFHLSDTWHKFTGRK